VNSGTDYVNLFQGYKLYVMQMVAQLCISKEMCILHKCFHNFVHPSPVYPMWQIYISPVISATSFIIGPDSLLSFQNTLTCATFVTRLIIMILFCTW